VILLVDDDPDMRRVTESMLRGHGYRVLQSPNGRDALGQLRAHCPDVIVLDLNMPVMNGWQFREEQQRLGDARLVATPVVLLTGEDHAVHHAARLGAVGVLKKPFDPEALVQLIRTALPDAGAAQARV
jgi:CheY-like chemotaxis protein